MNPTLLREYLTRGWIAATSSHCGGVVNGSRLFFLRNRGEGVVLGIQSFDLVEDPLILLIRRTHLFMGSL